MKDLLSPEIDRHRERAIEAKLWGEIDRSVGGVFILPSPVYMINLRVIASNGDGWDHVSISTASRCPTWHEMDWIKRKFFREHEVVMQLHVPAKDHINVHPFCLHLWRPHEWTIPLPPKEMIA